MAAVRIEGHRKDKMKHLNLSEIEVGERFREEFGDMEGLVQSIKEKGIVQPISVAALPEGGYRLLAGGRRFAAATLLELPTIPAVLREYVDELDSREVELLENTYRKDFDWTERAKLTKAIDDLYKAKYGSARWSMEDTAEVTGSSKSTVHRDIALARALEILPDLETCDNATDALKMVKQFEEKVIMAELRKRQDKLVTGPDENHADPEVLNDQLTKGLKTMLKMADQNYMVSDVFKAMEGMKTDGNIQIIECDPPYGIDLTAIKGSKESVDSNVHSYKEVHENNYEDFLDRLTSELYRVAGKDCWLIFWYAPSWQAEVYEKLTKAGWQVDEIPAIWTKANGQTLQPELYLARGYEPFFMCRKGKPLMAQRGRLNVFNYAGVPPKQKYHPTQRPTELISEIFTTLGAGQQHVFVPFLGSGATLLSCYEVGFKGFGCDLNGEYKDKFMIAVEAQCRAQFEE